jgi:rhamnosyltransferase
MGASLALGKYVVFLTQDAKPANKHWLENLVKPLLDNKNIAGTYSRQIPQPDCNPCEWRDIEVGATPFSIIKSVDFKDEFQRKAYEKYHHQFILFSNVSSCIRKDILEKIPFNEKITMMEDQEWCKRALDAAYTIVYEATSVVYHSHNFSIEMYYKRHLDYGLSYKVFTSIQMTFKDVLAYTLFTSFLDFIFISRQRKHIFWKMKWIVKAPFIRFAMRYGFYKGLFSIKTTFKKKRALTEILNVCKELFEKKP